MQAGKRRIGVFGGSFDPPHFGHLICARIVAETLALERILVVPTSIQPHKSGGPAASDQLRWKMLKAITADDPLFEPSRLELDRKGMSYTVETLEILHQRYPPESFKLISIIGIDAASEIMDWENPQQIVELAEIAVMHRKGWDKNQIPSDWLQYMSFIDTPIIEISSTDIRRRISEKLPIALMVGNSVNDIIIENNLYQ